MKCPRCKKNLSTKTIEDQKIDFCESCNGLWLHKHQLNRLVGESSGDVEMCSIDHKPHTDRFPPIECRECAGVVMDKINFLDYSDIILDHCPSCGSFWLDKDELEKMQVYINDVETGAHEVKDGVAYGFLVRVSRLLYSIFH